MVKLFILAIDTPAAVPILQPEQEPMMEDMLVLSSDSHVFEPPDLWTERIDAEFRDRAPRMQRVGDVDHLVVEKDQMIAGIGLISNAGARFENPEQISAHGRFEDVHEGGYDPDQHIRDMKIDGVSGELLYPSQGLFYYKVEDSRLMSAIFRTYNDWLAEFCSTNPDRLKGVAMINLDDVSEGVAELERCARMGMVAAMISEYPVEDRRYDSPAVRAVLGRRSGPGYADKPAHRHPARGPEPRRRRHFGPGGQRAGHQGLLPRHVHVRHDLLGRVRALPEVQAGHRGV